MAELIQFHCPACGATLRLPLEMAARQGPCPCCTREIVAPDPYRGIGAYAPAAPLPVVIQPFQPFVDSPQLVPQPEVAEAAPETTPEPVISELVQQRPCQRQASPQRAVFILSLLLASLVSLMAGYILGARSNWLISRTPYPVMHVPKLEPATEAPTKTVLIKPPDIESVAPAVGQPQPEIKPEPVKASALAETALKAFLDAPDWTTRSAYVLFPDKVREAMEAYSRKAPDGPTPYKSITVQNSYTNSKTGDTLFIFSVVTEQHPTGIPVALSETASGWQVDWQGFVEFRDDLFKAFADGPPNQTGRFHLIVSETPPPRAANTENEHFSTFLLDPPFPGLQRLAYVKKSAAFHSTLTAATANGAAFTPILDVEKRATPDGKTYLEITGLVASDWLPREP